MKCQKFKVTQENKKKKNYYLDAVVERVGENIKNNNVKCYNSPFSPHPKENSMNVRCYCFILRFNNYCCDN